MSFTFNKHLSLCVDTVINHHDTMMEDMELMSVSTMNERLVVYISVCIQQVDVIVRV